MLPSKGYDSVRGWGSDLLEDAVTGGTVEDGGAALDQGLARRILVRRESVAVLLAHPAHLGVVLDRILGIAHQDLADESARAPHEREPFIVLPLELLLLAPLDAEGDQVNDHAFLPGGRHAGRKAGAARISRWRRSRARGREWRCAGCRGSARPACRGTSRGPASPPGARRAAGSP